MAYMTGQAAFLAAISAVLWAVLEMRGSRPPVSVVDDGDEW